MTWRANIKLLILAIALTVWYRTFEAVPASWSTLGRVFPKLDATDIVEVEISRPRAALEGASGAAPIRLRYEVEDADRAGWWVVEPLRCEAFHPRARGIVGEIADLVRVAEATGADVFDPAPLVQVRFRTRGGREHTVELGPNTVDPAFAYARVDGEVFSVRREARDALSPGLVELRSRALFPVSPGNTAAFSLAGSARPELEVERPRIAGGAAVEWEDRWRLVEPLRALADRQNVESLLSTANAWTATDFVDDDATPEELARFGLDSPRYRLVARTKDGREVGLEVGRDVDAPGLAEPLVYVRRTGTSQVVSAGRAPLTELARAIDGFRSRYVLDLGVSEVVRIEVKSGDPETGNDFVLRRLEVSRTERNRGDVADRGDYVWRVEDRGRKETFDGDRERIEGVVGDLRQLTVEKFLAASDAAVAATRGTPRSRLRIGLDTGREETLLFGVRSDDPLDASADVFPVALPDEDGGYLVLSRIPGLAATGSYAFRDRSIIAVDPAQVVEIVLRHGSTVWALARAPGETTWDVSDAVELAPGKQVDGKLVNRLTLALHRDVFRVVRYLPDVTDAAALGLGGASSEWDLTVTTHASGTTTTQRLAIGKPVPAGLLPGPLPAGAAPEYAARLVVPESLVFTISSGIPDRLEKLHAHLEAITTR